VLCKNVRSFSSRIEATSPFECREHLGDSGPTAVLRMNTSSPISNCAWSKAHRISGLARPGILDFALLEEAPRDDRLTDRELFSQPLMFGGRP